MTHEHLATPEPALDALIDQVRRAIAERRPLMIRGGGSKHWYGEQHGAAEDAVLLDTRGHSGVIDYDPSELVISARCGTPLAELEAVLAAGGQMFACEPPHFGAGATVGGCIAAGLSGPRRASAGSVRDFVLGAKLINGRGQHLAFGGQVIKNVAGYDVSRLLAGSLGILGVITEVSLKVVPRPPVETTLRLPGLAQEEAITRLNQWGGHPLPVSATCWYGGVLSVRLSGATAAVRTARTQLGGDDLDAALADGFWHGLREQQHPFFALPEPLWRLSLPSVAAPVALPGETLIEWGGALRWLKTSATADAVRAAARAAGGHATLFRAAGTTQLPAGCFTELDPVLAGIHRRLKAEFDPDRLFNRGRMYRDL
jgi:glycolate oxidase FAD binding subunit